MRNTRRIPRPMNPLCENFVIFLSRWSWQWIVTLTFSDDFRTKGPDACKRKMMEWIRNLQKQEHMQVGCIYVLSFKTANPHIHLLMIGNLSSDPDKSLENVCTRTYEKKWPFYARINVVNSYYGVTKYLASQDYSMRDDRVQYENYNMKLLKKHSVGIPVKSATHSI